MTLVYISPLAASDPQSVGTHVFIIGVGEYPCLLGGDPKRLLENPMSLKQLSSPPESARALANWFLERQGSLPATVGFHNSDAPLATVEMLLSPSQTYTRAGGDVLVDPATRANIADGFARWKARASAHAGNTAVFYFCGHGVSGANDCLLPSDFGAINRDNPWADAIDITETARAMRRLVSGPLYFLIDACRQASRDALSPGATPPALAYVDFGKPVRGFTRLMLWAAGEGTGTRLLRTGPRRDGCSCARALTLLNSRQNQAARSYVLTLL
jgi:Caspase domain